MKKIIFYFLDNYTFQKYYYYLRYWFADIIKKAVYGVFTSIDCDLVEVSDPMKFVSQKALNKFLENYSEWAEGPFSFEHTTKVDYLGATIQKVDHITMAWENGHGTSVLISFILLVLFLGFAAFQASGQVVTINQVDSINVLSWCNIEVTHEDNYHVQLVTNRKKAAIIISNQVAARQDNYLTLPDGEYVIRYLNKTYVLNYSDSLYQWTRIRDCRTFIKLLVSDYLHPH